MKDAMKDILMFLCILLGSFCLIVTCLFFRDKNFFLNPFAVFTGGFFFLAGRFSA